MTEFVIDTTLNPGCGIICKGKYNIFGLFYKPLTYIFSKRYHGITLYIEKLSHSPSDKDFLLPPIYLTDISYDSYEDFSERLESSIINMKSILAKHETTEFNRKILNTDKTYNYQIAIKHKIENHNKHK